MVHLKLPDTFRRNARRNAISNADQWKRKEPPLLEFPHAIFTQFSTPTTISEEVIRGPFHPKSTDPN